MAAKATTTVKIQDIQRAVMMLDIEGISSYIPHQWDEKNRKMMRDKKMGKKTKTRAACDPSAEADAGTYRDLDGNPGIPATAIKNACISAAHKDLGVPKTVIRQALFIVTDQSNVVPITYDKCEMREDVVRVGMSSADLRYRNEFFGWRASIKVEIDREWLQPQDVVALLNRAGFGIGVGEWRPEKGSGVHGRFKVVTDNVSVVDNPKD